MTTNSHSANGQAPPVALNGAAARASSRRWPIIVVGMLAAHMAFIATAITLATRSRYEVIPNYYQKSLDWDKNRVNGNPSVEQSDASGQPSRTIAPSTNPAN